MYVVDVTILPGTGFVTLLCSTMQPSDIVKGWENGPTYLSHCRRLRLQDPCHFVRLCVCVYIYIYIYIYICFF